MTTLAVKMLVDENGDNFVPYASTAGLYDPDGETIAQKIAKKLETSSVIAGNGISVVPDSTNNTVEINCTMPGATLINNLTTTTSNQGALDAYQGYLLKNMIPTKLNQLNDRTTDLLSEPRFRSSTTVTTRPLFMMTRANRLTLLPPSQVIIEKSTDAGVTWVDYGATDDQKRNLFNGRNAGSISIPLKNGVRSTDCMVRITITGMRYNVPSGTAETVKYDYWNSNYIASCERYCQLHTLYFWVNAVNDKIWVKVERATGANSTTWNNIFDTSSNADRVGLSGWSGMDFVTFAQGVFGGGTTQTGNYWNYRITFRTCSSTTTSDATLFDDANLGTGYTTSAQSIAGINGYGDTMWTVPNNMAYIDHAYTWDNSLNVTFPANLAAATIHGYTIDTGTNNTSDTWVPVFNGSTIQHRVIPNTYNSTSPTLTGLTVNGAITTSSIIKNNVTSGEANVGAAYNGSMIYLYANANNHGLYDGTYGDIITVNSNGKSFAGNASSASLLSTNSSGQGTGIALSGRGSNYIYAGPNDAANGLGGALNNLVFSSWYGVSFTTNCGSQTYTGTNAVSINCRSGEMYAKTIYLNGSRGIRAADFSFSNGTLYITTT